MHCPRLPDSYQDAQNSVECYVHSSAGQGELVGGCPLCRREETMTRWSATRGVLKCGMRPGDWSRQ